MKGKCKPNKSPCWGQRSERLDDLGCYTNTIEYSVAFSMCVCGVCGLLTELTTDGTIMEIACIASAIRGWSLLLFAQPR